LPPNLVTIFVLRLSVHNPPAPWTVCLYPQQLFKNPSLGQGRVCNSYSSTRKRGPGIDLEPLNPSAWSRWSLESRSCLRPLTVFCQVQWSCSTWEKKSENKTQPWFPSSQATGDGCKI